MNDYGLDLAVIGNGRTAALLEPSSRIVWWCLPRYDGDPLFCRLLAGEEEKGFTDVVLDQLVETRSNYVRNTALVVTELIDSDSDGGAVRITDFAPRFQNYGRTFRPPQLVRIIEPIAGMPRITIRFRTTHHYGVPVVSRSAGSNHIRYWRDEVPVRLTTDAALLCGERGLVPAHPARAHGVRHRRAVRGHAREHLLRILRAHARLLAGMGAAGRPFR